MVRAPLVRPGGQLLGKFLYLRELTAQEVVIDSSTEAKHEDGTSVKDIEARKTTLRDLFVLVPCLLRIVIASFLSM